MFEGWREVVGLITRVHCWSDRSWSSMNIMDISKIWFLLKQRDVIKMMVVVPLSLLEVMMTLSIL